MSDFNNAFGTLVDSYFNNFESIKAFLPNQLPFIYNWSYSVYDKLLISEKLFDKLRGIFSESQDSHSNIELTSIIKSLATMLLYKESTMSSAIEGTRSTALDILIHERLKSSTNDDLEETLGSKDALTFALDQIEDGYPVNLILIREVHDILLKRANPERKSNPGNFRITQVAIGSNFYPSPPSEVPHLMKNLENYINDCKRGEKPDDLPPILRIALLHYQFEAIHPFEDGNGRIGRMLISLLIRYWDLLPASLVHLGDYFKINKENYYTRLYNVSKEGDITQWFDYFLDGIITQSNATLSSWDKAKTLAKKMLDTVVSDPNLRISDELRKIIAFVTLTPVFTIKEVVDNTGIMDMTVRNNVRKLSNLGFIESDNKNKNNLYSFKPYWEIIL